MKIKPITVGIAMLVATSSALASSSLKLTITNLSIDTVGFYAPDTVTGSFSATVQDQVGWTAAGTPALGAATSQVNPYPDAGISITSPLGTHAEVIVGGNGIPNSLVVSTPDSGGFAQAEQDFTLSFLLAAHNSITVSIAATLYGSNSGYSNGVFEGFGQFELGDQSMFVPFSFPFAGNANSASGFAMTSPPRSITFTNTTDSDIKSSFHSKIAISTREAIPAVPEPNATWLALAGVALLAGKRRLSNS